ncbi:MAG TPA: right-handed parallel beta-helix repeat-containing protein [Baekduia sp.]|nr:right-handed parallel beta-helix repeat-containing protein [Baekduia sp.]
MNAWIPRAAVLTAVLAAAPATAWAHLERPSYWPDPKPDTAVQPAAGGEVPSARSLATAVTGAGPGRVRVVCQRNSLTLALRSIEVARKDGFRIRPSQPERKLSRKQARRLAAINRSLKRRCRYDSIQAAVDATRNNDRVVIMPGRYTEPRSREQKTNDPRCNPSLLQNDQTGRPTPSYAYQATCPNDQNLVHVLGREVKGQPLTPPRGDRHGIPEQELGACIRCNVQIEGSGVIPEDVLLDAGKDYERPLDPQDKPGGHAKHVVMRTDRTDGLVVRNLLLRGALEHGFYTEETDGVLLDKVKFFWNADYGHLSFTTDHNVIQNCDAMGAGDAGVYPGASPQTGDFRNEEFYPEKRFNSVVRWCDLHGSTLAYSGSMGNSVRITENHIYANTAGISSDTLSAPGHPGFPADGLQVDHNYIYSNNLDLYGSNPPIEPLVPMPIGSGIVWPGMNGGKVFRNYIFDNWRHGTVLTAVPDQVAGDPEGNVDRKTHCTNTQLASTSCGNVYEDNIMGRVPPGFTWPTAVGKFGNRTGDRDAKVLPNGVDFWWDEFPGNNGNCWKGNTGPDGTAGSVTGSGAGLAPDPLPGDCASSMGTGDVVKEGVLIDCVTWYDFKDEGQYPLCYWFRMPQRPGTPAAARDRRAWQRTAQAFAHSADARALRSKLRSAGAVDAFTGRHG